MSFPNVPSTQNSSTITPPGQSTQGETLQQARLQIGPGQNVYALSFLLSALGHLSESGVDVSIQLSRALADEEPRLTLNGVECTIDLRDSNCQFCQRALEDSAYYFKRSYNAQHLPPRYAHKIRPFGLNYGARSSSGDRLLWGTLIADPFGFAKLSQFRTYVRLPRVTAYEFSPSHPVDNIVFFQTRVWDADEIDEFSRDTGLNVSRAQVVQALRRNFGSRFRGGLIPTPLARREYRDLITNEPYIRSRYVRSASRALVGVSTVGLNESHPFKIAEYLASSKCIVTEPLSANTLPHPLHEGVNHLTFATTDACVSRCEYLLCNPGAAKEMRLANWDYYLNHVHYTRRLISLYELTFKKAAQ